jgi:hypothetical protein
LNSVVSGLISRTILNGDFIGPDDYHGCLHNGDLASSDLSKWHVEAVMDRLKADLCSVLDEAEAIRPFSQKQREEAASAARAFMAEARRLWGVTDENLVKPGLGEATRVLLRRRPALLVVRDAADPDVAHALLLAAERGVPVEARPDLPYRAAAVIEAVF